MKSNNNKQPSHKVSEHKLTKHKFGIGINDTHLQSEITVKIDGEVTQKFKGSSFLYFFLHMLERRFHEMGAVRSAISSSARRTIGDIYQDGNDVVVESGSGSSISSSAEAIALYGIEHPVWLNGIWNEGPSGDGDDNNMFHFTYDDAMRFKNRSFDGTAQWRSNAGITQYDDTYSTQGSRRNAELFNNARILLGTDPQPEHFFYDGALKQESWDFDHGDMQISSVETTQEQSTFVVSRSFQNDTGSDLTVNELGLYTISYNGTEGSNPITDDINERSSLLMIGRDTFDSSQTVPTGSTITTDIAIRSFVQNNNEDTSQGTNSAILANFMELFRDHMNAEYEGSYFMISAAAPGGNTASATSLNSSRAIPGWKYGIVVGNNDHYVSTPDNYGDSAEVIFDGIPHGEGSGELFYGGSHVNPMSVDMDTGEAEIMIGRIFINRSGSPITIAEIGLNAGTRGVVSFPDLMMRTALEDSDKITIPNGEAAEIQYGIKVTWTPES